VEATASAGSSNLTADIWTFFDDEGRRTKVVQQIHEENTVQNAVTGLTLREGPVNFVQTAFFDPETGVRELISISGVSVDVRRGDEHLLDAGYLLIDGQTGEILVSDGPHPVRELLDGSFNITLALPGASATSSDRRQAAAHAAASPPRAAPQDR
jgi:hypothetical protein